MGGAWWSFWPEEREWRECRILPPGTELAALPTPRAGHSLFHTGSPLLTSFLPILPRGQRRGHPATDVVEGGPVHKDGTWQKRAFNLAPEHKAR